MIDAVTASRAVVAAVAAASLVLGVASCGEGAPEPRRAPSSPATSSVATSPTTEPIPDMPEAALGHGESAARAFVNYWLTVLNYSIESGDTTRLRSLSADRCKSCALIAQTIDDTYSAGGEMSGGLWEPRSVRPLPLDRGADWAGYVTADISSQTVADDNGKLTKYKAGPGYMYAYVADSPNGWRMVYLDIPV
ncbi:DUF6318 family protein [Nocardioides mangrovi]|uniref:DUF6318 family protein n=1 Tax=Nocardioides mangrovi TaxID=2874580 RepID=A0ABS7U924_9ACTN|nr:DUF6318 family protein [Nocardioides mangrovi]MBZ5737327.1 DUF6318 family protein [Nocardioides mangrovi]